MIRWSESICSRRLSEICRSTPSWNWSYSSGAPPLSSFLRVMSPASDASSVVCSFFPSVCSFGARPVSAACANMGTVRRRTRERRMWMSDSGPLCPSVETGLFGRAGKPLIVLGIFSELQRHHPQPSDGRSTSPAPRLVGRLGARCGMSLLPPTSTFAERVEVLFAVVRGRGLALGPLGPRPAWTMVRYRRPAGGGGTGAPAGGGTRALEWGCGCRAAFAPRLPPRGRRGDRGLEAANAGGACARSMKTPVSKTGGTPVGASGSSAVRVAPRARRGPRNVSLRTIPPAASAGRAINRAWPEHMSIFHTRPREWYTTRLLVPGRCAAARHAPGDRRD